MRIVEAQGRVEVRRAGSADWSLSSTVEVLRPFDRIRTGPNSRVALRWSDKSVIPFGASTELEILPPHRTDAQSGLRLFRGILSFFHREEPGRIRVLTRGAVAGIEGTEFVLAVDDSDRTTISVIDGKVSFGNEHDTLVLRNGEQAVVELGGPPVRTAGFIANNVLQWSFFYPAVIDVRDLHFTSAEAEALSASLAHYEAGDLLKALAAYPNERQAQSDEERIFRAALLLSVGQVEGAEAALDELSQTAAERHLRLGGALRQLVAAVKRQEYSVPDVWVYPSELLARSYYAQSLAVPGRSLQEALDFARQATSRSPRFGFAWARVAELEFSFGRVGAARDALHRALQWAPRNAQAIALQGFLFAAQNHTRRAIESFDHALAIDSALANAWLGRGLCRIRLGDVNGREDLLIAAALEPQRAELRSYLGKAFADAGESTRADHDLDLAKRLDPEDPSSWLYSALLHQQNNEINDAIRDLEQSNDLNDNRAMYRSQVLLDQDRAVRSASLARIYQDAGMADVALREAARAVNTDYSSYSAHLFLADSLNPGASLMNRRYESPASAEYMVANLLAPVGAGTLSPVISQAEYSRLFERNRLGVVSTTDYLSRGAWKETGVQYGRFEKFSYDLNWLYASDPGQHRNNDSELWQIGAQFKQQITPSDTIFFRATQLELEAGDIAQHYNPARASHHVRIKETQEPVVSIGYHHEWNPGIHTLFLATRVQDTFRLTNAAHPTIVTFRPDIDPDNAPGPTELTSVHGITMQNRYRTDTEMYSAELQQIWETHRHNTVVGSRFQYGWFEGRNLQRFPSSTAAVFPPPPEPAAAQDVDAFFRRVSVYGYHHWQVLEPLQIIGGVTYDLMTFPENLRTTPMSADEKTIERVSPKAGFIWTPVDNTVVRFAYTRSLAGASGIDQGFHLEPTQVAGFVQSYRNIIPESVAGGNPGADFETFGLAVERKFSTGTFIGVAGEILNSTVRRTVGAFDVLPDQYDWALTSGLKQHLDYHEPSVTFSVDQLVGRTWSFGTRYRLSKAVLESDFPAVSDDLILANFRPREELESVLHQVHLHANYYHRCGFFSTAEALWFTQSNDGYRPARPGEEFWHFNVYAGYRFWQRNAELRVGILNVTDQDYRLSPLNIHAELPRERTIAVRLQFAF